MINEKKMTKEAGKAFYDALTKANDGIVKSSKKSAKKSGAKKGGKK